MTPDTSFVLYKNDICLLNSGFVLSQQLSHDDDVVFTLLFEKNYLIKNILKDMKESSIVTRFIMDYILNNINKQNYIIFHGQDNDRITHAIEDMLCEFIENTPYGELLIDSYVRILFIEMMNSPYDYCKKPESRQTIQLAEILNYIHTNYSTCSLETQSKKFKEKYGMYPKEYRRIANNPEKYS